MKALGYFLSSCRVFKFQQASSSSLNRFSFTHYAIPFRHKIRPIRAIRFDAIGRRRRLLFHKSRRIIAGRGWRGREGGCRRSGVAGKGVLFWIWIEMIFFLFFFLDSPKITLQFRSVFLALGEQVKRQWRPAWRGPRRGGWGINTHTRIHTGTWSGARHELVPVYRRRFGSLFSLGFYFNF